MQIRPSLASKFWTPGQHYVQTSWGQFLFSHDELLVLTQQKTLSSVILTMDNSTTTSTADNLTHAILAMA